MTLLLSGDLVTITGLLLHPGDHQITCHSFGLVTPLYE